MYEPIHRKADAKALRQASELSFNHPDIEVGDVGPLIFEAQANIIRNHLDDAQAKGARVLHGGNIVNLGGGLWCEPTVIVDVDHTMKIMRDETFGPVIPIMTFASEQEAVKLANDTTYGLSATVLGEESRAITIGKAIRAGGIWINDFDTMGVCWGGCREKRIQLFGLGWLSLWTRGIPAFHHKKGTGGAARRVMKRFDYLLSRRTSFDERAVQILVGRTSCPACLFSECSTVC